MAVWYAGSTKYSAIAQWAASTAYNIGDIVRQKATPTVGNERAFRCTTAGTSGASEPAWTLTKGATKTDNTVTWTECTGNSSYGWSAAAARIGHLCTSSWAAAGDTIYVSSNHAESDTSNITVTVSAGTASNVLKIVSVNDGASPPTARATGASISASGTTTGITISGGYVYIYGLTISVTSTFGAISLGGSSAILAWLDSCTLSCTNAGVSVGVGGSGTQQWVALSNVTISAAGGVTKQYGSLYIYGGSLAGVSSTNPALTPTYGVADCYGWDLSALASTNYLQTTSNVASSGSTRFIDCKLPSGIGLYSSLAGAQELVVINSDSGSTNYRYARSRVTGDEVHETTIVRGGGASDGTTVFSRKVTTSSTTGPFGDAVAGPYRSQWIERWNETTGSALTVSIPTVTDNVTLKDNEAWIEVEYLGNASYPLSTVTSDRLSDLIFGTAANQDTDSTSTWTTTGLTTPVKQTLSVSVTPQQKGLIRARVCVAKASTTVYYDPLISVT